MGYRIKQASVLDAQAVADHRASWFAERYAALAGERTARQLLAADSRARAAAALASYLDAGGYVWVAVDDAGSLAAHAFAGVSDAPDAPTPLELVQLCVDAAVEDPALADALLLHTLGDAPAFTWVVEADADATAFFTRNGFAPDDARRTEIPGVDEIRLVRG